MEKEKFNYYIKTEKNNWEVVIGLEVPAQVTSISKLLSIPIVLPRNMLRKSSFVENFVYKIQF